METQVFDTKPLLRPHQVEEMKAEVGAAEAKLSNPAILDKGEARKQLIRTRKSLEEQTPRPPVDAAEEGRMVARSKVLLNEVLEGMPSQEEMRKAPPGAVDKHMGWEQRNKAKIIEWKNLQLRLRPGERESANLERYRPKQSSLSMDNAYITGKQIYIPDAVGATVTFSDAELERLRALKPGLAETVGAMTNEQRAVVKDMLSLMPAKRHAAKPEKKARKQISPETRAMLIARLADARIKKAEKKAAAGTGS